MKTKQEHLTDINAFEAHYQYDSRYMKQLLDSSIEAYQHFADFLPLAHFRQKLSLEDYWIAKTSVMQAVDCGACLQLNVDMAKEQGIDAVLLHRVLYAPQDLSPEQQDLRDYARGLTTPEGPELAILKKMTARFEEGELLEFGLAAASAMVFPTIKRSIGDATSCALSQINVA